jgi:hypothetical protein
VHEEELKVLDVADEESLVAGGHHVAGLLVGTVADLVSNRNQSLSPARVFFLPRLHRTIVRERQGKIIEANVPRAWQWCP